MRLSVRTLKLTERGDIRRRDCLKLADAEAEYKIDATRPYGHAFKAIEAYEKWFAAGDDQARRQLAILRLLGLFDRPASPGSLTALRAAPAIAGLNEALAGGADRDWNIALGRLAEINLVGVQEDQSVDCHPLLREYFAVHLKTKTPTAWQAGHRRLYEHLCATTQEGDQPTLEDLQPLYQAVTHGCQAGLHKDVRDNVYRGRILRGEENYSTFKLGALGSDLGAIACFFEQPWRHVSPALPEVNQAWLLNEAAFTLRALGRMNEVLEPMRVGLEKFVALEDWEGAAGMASNLSGLELTLGKVALAVGDAEQSVTYANRSGEVREVWEDITTHADALHQAGRRAEAETRFREAEQMQAERQPAYPLLYSTGGFRYCDLLLAAPERAAWQKVVQGFSPPKRPPSETGTQGEEPPSDGLKPETTLAACRAVSQRAAQTLKWEEGRLLDIALDHLTLGRAALYEAILSHSDIRVPSSELDSAVAGLRRAGRQIMLPHALLTRAWLRFLTPSTSSGQAAHASAQEDLDEAWEIAERGPMKLFLADIHLSRARLFGRMKDEGGRMKYPWESPAADLAAARKLIQSCGYHRRDEEVADAEAALRQ